MTANGGGNSSRGGAAATTIARTGGNGGTRPGPKGGTGGIPFDGGLPEVPEEGEWTSCVGDWPAARALDESPVGVIPKLSLKGRKTHDWVSKTDPVPLEVGGRLAFAVLEPIVFNEEETDFIIGNNPEIGHPFSLVGVNDISFVGSRGRGVARFTLDATGLTRNWMYVIRDPIRTGIEYMRTSWHVMSPAKQVFFGAASRLVYALDAETGALIWKSGVQTLGYTEEPTVLMGVGDTILVQWSKRRMFAVSTKDGTPRGRFRTNETLDVMIDLISLRHGFIGHTVANENRFIVFFDKCGKETRRIAALPDEVPVLALSGDRLLTDTFRLQSDAADAGRILKMDGTEIARHDTTNETFNPLAEGADGTIYSLSCGYGGLGTRMIPKLQALNERMEVVQQVELPFLKLPDYDFFYCPPYYSLLTKAGVLTLANENGTSSTDVIHFQTGSKGLSSGEWPTRLGDAANSLWAKTPK